MEGAAMLQFKEAHKAGEKSAGQIASELWQLVDLSAQADAVNRGGVSAHMVAHFNRITGRADVDRRFGLALTAFRGTLGHAQELWQDRETDQTDQLARSVVFLHSDDDPASWERLTCTLPVPPGRTISWFSCSRTKMRTTRTVASFPAISLTRPRFR